jgi:two-component sensor histidine kinase
MIPRVMHAALAQLFSTTSLSAPWAAAGDASAWQRAQLAAELALFAACAAAPIMLAARARRGGLRTLPSLWLLAAFMLACGLGQLLDASRFWHPNESVLGVSKLLAAALAWLSLLALQKALARAPSPALEPLGDTLAAHVSERAEALIEQRVEQRTTALSAQLREHELRLQEMHHRVKNNLQVISSLINLQRARTPDATADAALEQCQARVLSIARVHELLQRAHDSSRVSLAEYVEGLLAGIEALGARSPRVRLDSEIDEVWLAPESAVPCGLILTELITNALKHGFPDQRSGRVHACVRHDGSGELVLAVSDDGVGLPAGFELEGGGSLGLTITRALADQLNGSLAVVTSPGRTTFELRFPAHDPRRRSDARALYPGGAFHASGAA